MNRNDKLRILDELIDRVSQLTYSKNHPHYAVKDDTLSFVRNTISEPNRDLWVKRLNDIRWFSMMMDSESADISAWEEAKCNFVNVLRSIRREIELFDSDDIEGFVPADKIPLIFLSHSSSDKTYADALEKFIIGLGVKNDQLIYTSHPLHKIPLDANIYDYLRKNIHKEIFMIILWSDKYLESPACLNEMGAAWVTQSDYTNIFTPTFSWGNPKFRECAVDTRKMGAVLKDDAHCKANMLELKDKIQSLFGLENDEQQTTFLLDQFIKEISPTA